MLVYQFDSCARITVIDNLKRESERNKLSQLVPKTNSFNCTDYKYEKDRSYIFKTLYLLIRTKYCRFAVIKLLSPICKFLCNKGTLKYLRNIAATQLLPTPTIHIREQEKEQQRQPPAALQTFLLEANKQQLTIENK